MTSSRLACAIVVLAATASGCTSTRDPRQVLADLQVPYTASSWLAQAGAGDKVAVAAFLDAGMDPNTRDASGHTALMNAAAGGHADVVRTLIERGAQVNVTSLRGMTPLGAAVLNDHVDAAALLLDAGATLNAPTADRAPLLLAIRAQRPHMVSQLLTKGAPAYIQDHQWSALMMAAFLGNLEIVNALLSKDPNLNAANDEGGTALMYAASAGHTAVVRALLARGAVIDARDESGATALMLAANNGHADTTQALLEAGPDQTARTRTGATAHSLATVNGHAQVALLLDEKTARAARATP